MRRTSQVRRIFSNQYYSPIEDLRARVYNTRAKEITPPIKANPPKGGDAKSRVYIRKDMIAGLPKSDRKKMSSPLRFRGGLDFF